MTRWIPWLNLAFFPTYIALLFAGVAIGTSVNVGKTDGWGLIWVYGYQLVAWAALVWISRHVDEVMGKIALLIPAVVLLWDFGLLWVLRHVARGAVDYLAPPMSVWLCFIVVVVMNAVRLRHRRLTPANV